MGKQTVGNREEWLAALVGRMRLWFAEIGLDLPFQVRVSIGFPLKGAVSNRRQTIGQCFAPTLSADGSTQIFISPVLGDALRVADVLLHELCHAAVGIECGHKGPFVRAARAFGLEGKPTATIAGKALTVRLNDLIAQVGPYPHAELRVEPEQSQSTRLLKAYCTICRYTVRVTRVWLQRGGPPICPICMMTMNEAPPKTKTPAEAGGNSEMKPTVEVPVRQRGKRCLPASATQPAHIESARLDRAAPTMEKHSNVSSGHGAEPARNN